jgi:Rieske Fe-S protein
MISRRSFFKRVFSTTLGIVILPLSSVGAKKVAIRLDKAAKLKKVGGWTVLKVKGHKIIFVRDSDESVRALSAVCTHKQCLLGYNKNSKRIECGCHKSNYDLSGKVLKGPAPKALKAYPAELSKERVIISVD